LLDGTSQYMTVERPHCMWKVRRRKDEGERDKNGFTLRRRSHERGGEQNWNRREKQQFAGLRRTTHARCRTSSGSARRPRATMARPIAQMILGLARTKNTLVALEATVHKAMKPTT
jgi:hypothetical protein